MSSVQNGVDPRTGLYAVAINFPEVQTNDLRGPGFALALAYSSLNTQDSGYGYGWNLQLSQYTPGNQILSLSTGETFKVTGSDTVSGQLVMKEKKLDSFHFYQEDESHYRVVHKSGLVEILKVMGSTQNGVALPVEIRSPTGHKVTLGYAPFSATQQILAWVKDDSGRTLLTLDRQSTAIELLVQPFAGPEGGPLARFTMMLEGSDKYVTRIILPTPNEASWRFGYNQIRDHLCMTWVETPVGGREDILYQDGGHQFPEGSGRQPLPRVTRHLTDPGLGQSQIDVRYTYKSEDPEQGEKNFLGGGLRLAWDEDGLDNLYKYIGAYEYVCIETLWVLDESESDAHPVRKIERSFNQFHLLTRETTTQNNNVETVETTYYLTPDVAFDQQPNYCQLPKTVRTSWSVLDNPNRRRSETVSSTYDTYGNLRVRTQADGVMETSVWYRAAGEEGCPADPEGFVRQLKEKTVSPARSTNGQAPTLCTRYRYKALPELGDRLPEDRRAEDVPLKQWLTVESQTLVQLGSNETELEHTLFEHIDDRTDAFLHGRVSRQTVTLNGLCTLVDYDYSKFDSPQFGVPVQQTRETMSTRFDNVSKAIVREHSLFTSQELSSLVDGVQTHYYYDALNRLTREVVAPDTAFTATRNYEYTLSAMGGQRAEQLSFSARQIKTRSVLDGLGRLIFQESDHVDSNHSSRTRQAYAATYNAWGDLAEETEYDWLDSEPRTLKSSFEYDDWAQQCCVTGPDGVETHQSLDPIGTPESQGPIQRNWRQSAGPSPLISGLSESWLNPFGKPSQTRTLDSAGNEIATETYLYDGLGRCTQHTDAAKYTTGFVYDPWARLISSTLPDDSIVTRTYAAHSTLELPVGLCVSGDGVNETSVGTQAFDGLGRLTRTTSGTRTERYTYDAGQMQIKTRITPANDTIEYDYNLALTDQPISSHAPDQDTGFTYHSTSSRLTRARNEQGSREYEYDTANQLRVERWIDNRNTAWETLHSSSMQGRPIKRTDLKQNHSAGLDTVYDYDDAGRVKSIDQGQLQAAFEYNSLGELHLITTRDRAADSTLVTQLQYDDQGREILRTLTLNQLPPRTQAQTWQVDGLLQSRDLQLDGLSLLKETFSYDARGRLTKHECEGSTLPRDGEGREIRSQIFSFDALDNIKLVLTKFADDTTERAIFTYAVDDDPCQLQGITYSPPKVTNPTFSYDLNGCQLNDERGQRLSYDSQSRLMGVESPGGQVVSQYRYDGHDHLVTSKQGNESEALRFYQDEQLSNLDQDGHQTHFFYHADRPLGQQASDNSQTLLLLTDANHSVIGESRQRDLRSAVYSAYGERHSDDTLRSLLAFNGEMRDEASGWYLLGQGYRAYNPGLMRFHSPDSLSPFGSGGVNPYTYCLGNPIALRDPTGHEAVGWSGRLRKPDEDTAPPQSSGGGGVEGWISVAVGAVFVAIGVASFIGSLGTSGPASLALIAVGTALSAGSTIASAVAVADNNEQAGRWGQYLGYGAMVASAPFIVKGAYQGVMNAVRKTAIPVANKSTGHLLLAGIFAPKAARMVNIAPNKQFQLVQLIPKVKPILAKPGAALLQPANLAAASAVPTPFIPTPPRIPPAAAALAASPPKSGGTGAGLGGRAGGGLQKGRSAPDLEDLFQKELRIKTAPRRDMPGNQPLEFHSARQ
ncbi:MULTISPECIES: RHS repeat domain-containing protein [Pseudomonas]|uniref:RHS repeat domain-containing protein n=1 Tax=Pseudomonas TaxID=286 RepID=UPI001E4DBCBA|nr:MULTISPECIES: RHS repeat-associated core domain-containing protein [Pseudomonas]MCD4530473.1 RHS repeat-associated core domain-containing protein [Pseudomonas sp. C3-2018]